MVSGLYLGLFGRFGRSHELRLLDQALRGLDLHPNLVPEAVKLTMVTLLREDGVGVTPQRAREAAEVIAYCMIGAEGFAGANDLRLTEDVERRIEAALNAGDSLDARLVLLTLHAKVIQPSVVHHFQLETE
jgi:hypothetical protein